MCLCRGCGDELELCFVLVGDFPVGCRIVDSDLGVCCYTIIQNCISILTDSLLPMLVPFLADSPT